MGLMANDKLGNQQPTKQEDIIPVLDFVDSNDEFQVKDEKKVLRNGADVEIA